MTRRGRAVGVVLAVVGVLGVLPAVAGAHAALLKTSPSASGTVNSSPADVALTYSEPVEPRFAIVSVTNADGENVTTGRPARSTSNPNQLVTPLQSLPEGWYLVYWRVISVDGHPVRGAFTFAVGPNPGPAPQFQIPSLSETAATTGQLIARWAMFLTFLSSIGLAVFRLGVAQPVARDGVSLKPITIALAISLGLALVAIPVYVLIATADFAQRSIFDLGNVVPLIRDSAFGRGYVDLEIVTALFALAVAVAIATDRPERPRRSVANLLALAGAALAAGAALFVPGLSGHAGQYSPRGESLILDAVHLAAVSTWIGGLIGLIVLAATAGSRRMPAMVSAVPRFSRVAFSSVAVIILSGTLAALTRFPTLSSVWQTGYGQALLVKIGILLAAMAVAAINLLDTKPRIAAARERPDVGPGAVALLRRLIGVELFLLVGAIFAAAVLSSLAPPPKSLASIGHSLARVGPGVVAKTITKGPYALNVKVAPNRAAVPNAFSVKLTKNGKPVTGADVVTTFTMLDMEMGQQAYRLTAKPDGTYSRDGVPSLVMVGHWGLNFHVTPPGGTPFDALVTDKAGG